MRPTRPALRSPAAVAALALIAGVVAQLVLIAVVPTFVTTDGAAHLDEAAALARLAFGPASPVDGYVEVSWLPATNLLPQLPLVGITALVGSGTAEKLMLAAYVVLFPASFHYAVTGVRCDAGWLAILALPLTFNLILGLGFYSFCYGLVVLLAIAGYRARRMHTLSAPDVLALALGLALVYAAHAFVFAMAVLFLVVTEAWAWSITTPRRPRTFLNRLARVLIPAAPPVAAFVAWLLTRPADEGGPTALIDLQLRSLAESLTFVLQLVTFDQREALFAVLLAAMVIGMVVIAIRTRRAEEGGLRVTDGMLSFTLILLCGLTFVDAATTLWSGGPGAFITSRVSVIAACAVILWLAAQRFSTRIQYLTVAVSISAWVGLIGLRLPWYANLSDGAEAFASVASCVGKGATMAQVNLARVALPSRRTDQLSDETGRVSAMTGGLDLGNAAIGDTVHLLRYRPGLDPYRYLRGRGGLPATVDPIIDPERYRSMTGGTLDYILVFGRHDAATEVLASGPWLDLEAQLHRDYRMIAVADDGRLEVFERIGTPAAADGIARRASSSDCPGRAS